MRPVVLCFSGLDPSGGAGLQADIESVAALGAHAAVVCTALTVQDSQQVHGFEPVSPQLIRRQAEAVLDDMPVAAIKLGMLGSGAIADVVGELLDRHPGIPVVLDPVLAANSGGSLAGDDLAQGLFRLFARATVITPNSIEARRLAETDDLDSAIARLAALGARHVLLKGGHEPGAMLLNRLFSGTTLLRESRIDRLQGEFHGSGCSLASALAAGLAAGLPLPEAVALAEEFVSMALRRADRPRDSGQFLPVRVTPVRFS
ncbi:MAG: hydroxymethylpyrimidine/phosphomethylpyrimidine kinase [Moraxellaceae bacterium]|jgi:hydroxymethylpyrimidine kinase/phosphomethylpyrimidine kinase|nr:hydroxymethylpyrimidine/phosphomethylpyrimidine kinase [Moraxellaceae bacterium]